MTNDSKQKYEWDPDHNFAIQAALKVNRPLLVRGEPGIGKSSLALEAAKKLRRHFISEVITAKTEPNDLLWQYDGVMRLADATACCTGDQDANKKLLDRQKYTSPGVLWWAFDSKEAKKRHKQCSLGPCPAIEKKKKGASPKKGWVVLIDEIDKADADVPNSLLGALATGEFAVPGFEKPIQRPQSNESNDDECNPLIIITTNEERELPAAFLRRCLVLHMDFPKAETDSEKKAAIEWLMVRAKKHVSGVKKDLLELIAAKLLDARISISGRYKPGLAEYIDYVCAVKMMQDEEIKKKGGKSLNDIVVQVGRFTLDKNSHL